MLENGATHNKQQQLSRKFSLEVPVRQPRAPPPFKGKAMWERGCMCGTFKEQQLPFI